MTRDSCLPPVWAVRGGPACRPGALLPPAPPSSRPRPRHRPGGAQLAGGLRHLQRGQGGHTPLVHRPGCRRRSLCVRRPGSHLWSAGPLCPLCLHQRLLQLHHRHGARHPGGEDGRSTNQIRHSGLVASSSSKPQQS